MVSAVKNWLRQYWGTCLVYLLIFIALAGLIGGLATPAQLHTHRGHPTSSFKIAHQRAINSFVDSQWFGIARTIHDPPERYWADFGFILDGIELKKNSIELIGGTKEYGDRFLEVGSEYPTKKRLEKYSSRPLFPKEFEALSILRSGEKNHVSFPGKKKHQVIVIAPIPAQESCLKCHEGEVGTLLGAFNYTTTPMDQIFPNRNP